MVVYISQVDGIGYDDPSNLVVQPGLLAGKKLNNYGQTGNTVAGNVANQGVGTTALPALSAGATGNITITNSLITALSLIWLQVKRGTTTAGAGAVGTVLTALRIPTAGSCIVDVTNLGSVATLSTDYVVHYWVIN